MDNAKKQRKTTMRKTRDLFKKTGDSKGTFHVLISHVSKVMLKILQVRLQQ